MESKSYAETPGGGVSPLPAAAADPPPSGACQRLGNTGRRCHMLAADPSSPLCAHHARQQLKAQRRQHDAAARELLGDIADFSTAGEINFFLGNLVKQLARKRITRLDAIALAYISQLLLNSLPALDRQFQEERAVIASQTLRDSLRKRDPDKTSDHPDGGAHLDGPRMATTVAEGFISPRSEAADEETSKNVIPRAKLARGTCFFPCIEQKADPSIPRDDNRQLPRLQRLCCDRSVEGILRELR